MPAVDEPHQITLNDSGGALLQEPSRRRCAAATAGADQLEAAARKIKLGSESAGAAHGGASGGTRRMALPWRAKVWPGRAPAAE